MRTFAAPILATDLTDPSATSLEIPFSTEAPRRFWRLVVEDDSSP